MNRLWNYTDSYDFMQRVIDGMPPLIVCVACNGGIQGKEYNSNLPETADEIADSVHGAYEAGASMVHIHARDPENLANCARMTEIWRDVNRKVRERCPDIIINNTTGGDLESTMEERLSCLDARPEIASLNLVPDMSKFRLKARKPPLLHPHPEVDYDGCLPFSYKIVNHFASEMKKLNIKPELETYHPGGAWVFCDHHLPILRTVCPGNGQLRHPVFRCNTYGGVIFKGLLLGLGTLGKDSSGEIEVFPLVRKHLIDIGIDIQNDLIEKPYWIQTVMGYQTSSFPTVENVIGLLREFPEGSLWLCSGIGPFQLPMTTLSVLMGGHVRVGMEDNIYFRRGEKLASNAQSVERVVRIAHELNREIATPQEAREMLGIAKTPSSY